jgi:hypothetical protein
MWRRISCSDSGHPFTAQPGRFVNSNSANPPSNCSRLISKPRLVQNPLPLPIQAIMERFWLENQAQQPHLSSSIPAIGKNSATPPEAPDHGGYEIPVLLSRHSQQVVEPSHGGNLIPHALASHSHSAVQSAFSSGPARYGETGIPAFPNQPNSAQVAPQPASPYKTFGAPPSGQSYQQQSYHQQSYYQQSYHQQQSHQQPNPQYYPDYRQPSAGYPNLQTVRFSLFLFAEFDSKANMPSSHKHRPNINNHLPRSPRNEVSL